MIRNYLRALCGVRSLNLYSKYSLNFFSSHMRLNKREVKGGEGVQDRYKQTQSKYPYTKEKSTRYGLPDLGDCVYVRV